MDADGRRLAVLGLREVAAGQLRSGDVVVAVPSGPVPPQSVVEMDGGFVVSLADGTAEKLDGGTVTVAAGTGRRQRLTHDAGTSVADQVARVRELEEKVREYNRAEDRAEQLFAELRDMIVATSAAGVLNQAQIAAATGTSRQRVNQILKGPFVPRPRTFKVDDS